MFAAIDRRHLSFVVLIVGLLLVGVGSVRSWSAVSTQRAQALAQADSRLLQTLVPATARGAGAIRQQVRQLLADESGVAFTYITVRDANGGVLASNGRHAQTFGWLPASQARSWRAWLYRLLSAQSTLSVSSSRPLAVGFGISWVVLLTDSLLAWIIWPLSFCLGIVFVLRGIQRLRTADQPGKPASTSGTGLSPVADGSPRSATVKRPDKTARVRVGRGFEVIGTRPSTLETVARPNPVSARATAAPAADPSAVSVRPAVPKSPDSKPAAPSMERAPAVRSSQSATPSARAAPLPAVATVAESDSHGLGDNTLDLRFHPIWRGADRRVLAGGWAALAWRRGDGEIVDPETLVRLAEQEGALRAFTQWIAERFAMLHANWRALELLTVPIVLPIPSALLAFADAENIWRDALSRISHDPDDLLLQVDTPELSSDLSPPLRRAIVPSYVDGATGSECDLVFVRPEADHRCVTAERLLADTHYPMLVGPLVDPSEHAELLDCGERVAWFSTADNEANVYSPRAFARLMSQQAVVPL